MEQKERQPVRALLLITSSKLADKAAKLFHKGAIPFVYRLNGTGTASSEMLDILGIGSSDKSILISLMPKSYADRMLLKLHKELRFGAPGNGLAFTVPLSAANSHALKVVGAYNEDKIELPTRKDAFIMAEQTNVLIAAVVNQGFSEEVMDAAKQAGARGGTILHSRQTGDEQTMNLWGLSLQEEKEIILIVADSEIKLPIMRAISETCGMHSEAMGTVLSLPIDTVVGLNG